MAQGRPQLTVAGVPIRFELTFFLIIGLLGASIAPSAALLGAWVAVATLSIGLHEMGHALAYKAFGHPSHVVLMGFGGVTTGPRLAPGRSIVVSLAGPLSGIFLLGLPALVIARTDIVQGDDARLVVFYFVWVNLVWAFLNLLPVLPLDGGNVTQSAIELVTGRDGERATRILSIVVAGVGGLLALFSGYLFGALFAGFFLALNVNGLRQARLPEIRAELAEAQRALTTGDHARAAHLADDLARRRPPRDLLAVALEIVAWSRLLEGDALAAEQALGRVPKEVRPPASLTGSVALARGRIDEGLTLLAWGLVHDGDQGSKVFAIAASAQSGQAAALVRNLLALDDGAGLETAWKVQITLHQLGLFAASVEVGRALLDDGRLPAPEVGYHIARSLVRAGDPDQGLHWLNWVLDRGPLSPARLADDPDLASLRATAGFDDLRRRATATARP